MREERAMERVMRHAANTTKTIRAADVAGRRERHADAANDADAAAARATAASGHATPRRLDAPRGAGRRARAAPHSPATRDTGRPHAVR
ncbi:hypothetical protein WS83_00410 [Burkholderia sp. MSMB2042]|nr:hypothetical protein WS78_22025 [Burkholderia savannae]KVG37112.1 hypothetical protein WS77_22965 [Burkholderia sp. MSMB0265]KVG77737.1 hypothetical protein WS81_18225 [Burkholderia sp. MSMB2040]KVG94170.1 hypothetical protein WS83_00410 [Burkholderia sp. MSMB2042]KVG97655.1 hypothetical protein WS82_28030 [Burkholderia sp. MSMB2041]KVK84342.1 hypothetical protein WS91_05155 [Burkholderia sp. MSMB1498]